MRRVGLMSLYVCVLVASVLVPPATAQTGVVEGVVVLPDGQPAYRAEVVVLGLGRLAETDLEGRYRFEDIPAGSYELTAFQAMLKTRAQPVAVSAGAVSTASFSLSTDPMGTEITFRSDGRPRTESRSVHSSRSLDLFDLSGRMATSIGDVLDGLPGIARRSYGPGSARPIIRGLDGDRVLVVQDGARIGSLGSQSGDHAEPLDPGGIRRLEVLRGPATLIYASNALGGVIDARSHDRFGFRPREGVRGWASSSVGSANGQSGGSLHTEIGLGNWMVSVGGGGQRTGDYETPIGPVEHSRSRVSHGNVALGWFHDATFLTIDYKGNDGRYGIPYASEFLDQAAGAEEVDAVDLLFRRHSVRLAAGSGNLDTFLDSFELSLGYNDWNQDEVELSASSGQSTGMTFENQEFVYRGMFTHQPVGPVRGSFGFEGSIRSDEPSGEESLAPPVDQDMFAAFALEEADLGWVNVQLGARIETNGFEPIGAVERRQEDGTTDAVELPRRSLTGASVGLGARFDLWSGGALVTSYSSAFRSPALEERYNFGPHLGNLVFEAGDENLGRERANGVDILVRHEDDGLLGTATFFYYDFDDLVYLAPSAEVVDGWREANWQQDDARFIGTELTLDVQAREDLWINLGLDAVDGDLVSTGTPLPRLPPLRGRVGLDFRYEGLSVRPEVVVADSRADVFETETRTAGYAVFNIVATYTIARPRLSHQFSVDFFNVGNRLYRNHSSFIKDRVPEIGRGVRFSYAVMVF